MRIRLCIPVIVLLGAGPAAAQTEFIVNTSRDSAQRDPQIERDAAGNYVIVWKADRHAAQDSRGDIVMQRFLPDGTPSGAETEVNTRTAGDQERPAAAMNETGSLVVVWASLTDVDSAYDIYARRFLNGAPQGDEVLVNTAVDGSQTDPDVAVRLSGMFVVVWDGWTALDDRDVFMRLFGGDGMPRSVDLRVNSTTAYSQARPAVRFRPDGSFVVVWESWAQDAPAGYGVVARLFDSTGTPLSAEIQVNSYTADYQWYADVETYPDNSFAVVWCSWEQDGWDGSIVFQRFAPDGTRRGGELLVNSTTSQYQWLPRIRRTPANGSLVVWSSWKQDGSREGVYAQLLDSTGRTVSFETPCNTTTESFQWEPDAVVTGPGQFLATWSSWGQIGRDYEVVARQVTPRIPQGYVNPTVLVHASGRSTSRITVHVVDSLSLTGHTYDAVFDSLPGKTASVSVYNTSTGDTLVRDFPVNRGEGVSYITPTFQGAALEVVPEFDLDLDFARSFMVNHTGTTLTFTLNIPSAGTKTIAPIDVALIWGSTDTLSDGSYAAVLDTALGANGKREVLVPFRAWNLTDDQRMELLVVESPVNKRWNVGERIIFLTPPAYRSASNNTHAEIRPTAPGGAIVMPGPGDTNVVLTMRPIRQGERFTFATSRAAVLNAPVSPGTPRAMFLEQNYPNPFNPSTTIRYEVAGAGDVAIRIFNILGQHVATLAEGYHQPGRYRIRLDATGFASGVYFYRMEVAEKVVVRKMTVVK